MVQYGKIYEKQSFFEYVGKVGNVRTVEQSVVNQYGA